MMVFLILNASSLRDQIICKRHSYQTQTNYLSSILILIQANVILWACLPHMKIIYSIHLFLNFEHQDPLLSMASIIKRGCIGYYIEN